VWHLLVDEESRCVVETVEQYADAILNQAALERVQLLGSRIMALYEKARSDTGEKSPQGWAAAAAFLAASTRYVSGETRKLVPAGEAAVLAALNASSFALRAAETQNEEGHQATLIRCVFGNPFRAVSLEPGWGTPTILALAQAAYEKRNLPTGTMDPTRLAALADALEETGCNHFAVLGHLRDPGPHVRGCWVVDALLGRE
jgi:hypothetical protein